MVDIPRRQLGKTDMEVTTLAYGAMELRGDDHRSDIDDAQAARILNAVLDGGINYIDTSIDYGLSEERIGRSIGHRRDEYFLASKCGCVVGAPRRSEHVHTAENIRLGVETSLRLLATEYLDLVQFHRSLTAAEYNEHGALGELLALQEEGKVRYIGVSGTLPNIEEQISMGVFDVFQVPYSALQRQHGDAIARASAAGAGIIVRGGVARGAPTNWEGVTGYMVPGTEMRDLWEVASLDELLDGMGRMEFTLRFTLGNPDLDATIVGSANPDHLAENIAAASKGPLAEDVMAEAERRLDLASKASGDSLESV